MDSVVTALGDDGLPVYDRPYVSADLRNVYSNFFSNGVFLNESTSLQVTAATGGMSINVAAGSCHINGAFGVEAGQKSFGLEAASASSDRIDTVVARLDLSIEERSLELYVITGTPSASPVRPSLTRNETVWELGLADVRVPKGATSISQATVTDTRLEDVRCGAVTPFAKLDTTSLFLQLQAVTDEAVEAMKNALDDTTAGHLQNQIDETKTQIGEANATVATTKWLKPKNKIPSGADLDTLTDPGSWYTSEPATKFANAPSEVKGAFLLYVYERPNGCTMQELLDVSTAKVYRRTGGEWQEALQGASAADMLSHLGGVAKSSIGEQIWEGSASVGSTISVPKLADYDVFAIYNSSSMPMVGMRRTFGSGGSGFIYGSFNSTDSGVVYVQSVILDITSATSLKVEAMRIFNCGTGKSDNGFIKGIRGLL